VSGGHNPSDLNHTARLVLAHRARDVGQRCRGSTSNLSHLESTPRSLKMEPDESEAAALQKGVLATAALDH